MHGTAGKSGADEDVGGGWLGPDDEWHVRSSLDDLKERLRVARHRAADRQRLADVTRAAGQEAFAVRLRHAADAHVSTARTLEEAVARLERCWSHLEEQRRWRARAAMSRQGAAPPRCAACAWRRAG